MLAAKTNIQPSKAAPESARPKTPFFAKHEHDTQLESSEAQTEPSFFSPSPFYQSTASNVQAKCNDCEQEKIQQKEDETPFLQTKLTIGEPGDKYEQEADAMAEKVVQRLADSNNNSSIQRMEEEEKEPQLQAKHNLPSLQPSADLESRLNATKGSGSPLPEDTRTSMESSFGTDFSKVRVHTNSGAVQMNQELGAQAFTHGSDVYFNAGKYNPENTNGQKLLAHELTHVIQQGKGNVSPTNQKKGLPINNNARLEQEANNAGYEFNKSKQPNHSRKTINPPTTPVIQGAWLQDSVTAQQRIVDEHSTAQNILPTLPMFLPTGVMAMASATQFVQWWPPKDSVGGVSQVALYKFHHYIFRHAGNDNDILSIDVEGILGGGAKAEDLNFAKAGGGVVGYVKVRTPDNPTAPYRPIFPPISEAGQSTANRREVGNFELEIPIGEGRGRITAPITVTDEGVLATIAESLTPPGHFEHSGRTNGNETIIEIILAASVEAHADIETVILGDIAGDTNSGRAHAEYILNWRNIAAPRTRTDLNPTSPGAHIQTSQTNVYRALPSDDRGRPQTNPGQFRVDSDGLSTFELANLQRGPRHTHKLQFIVLSSRVPGSGAVDSLLGGIGNYTPQYGEGHWSIAGKQPQDFTNYSRANPGRITPI